MNPSAGKIRLLIADDQPLILRGMSMMLGSEEDIEIVGLANDGVEAVEMAEDLKPDVILMDLQMPRLTGVEATKKITLNNPDVKIVAITTFATDDLLSQAIKSGARSYLLKDAAENDVLTAIRTAHNEYSKGPSEIFNQDPNQTDGSEIC